MSPGCALDGYPRASVLIYNASNATEGEAEVGINDLAVIGNPLRVQPEDPPSHRSFATLQQLMCILSLGIHLYVL
jgi:hypothetical protein